MAWSYQRLKFNYENFLKGKIFELFIEGIVRKAGFETDRKKLKIKQLTRFNTLKGRAGTYAPDVIGIFKMPVPFAYPLFLVGECKNYAKPLGIDKAREFLGAYSDIQQYNHISFRKNQTKFSQLFNQERFSYMPVLFSLNGFQDNPKIFMRVHGINFISYEKIPLNNELKIIINNLINKIDTKRKDSELSYQINKLKTIEDIDDIRKICKTDPDEEIQALRKLIANNSSRIAVLDKILTIHILIQDEKKFKIDKRKLKLKLEYNGDYFTIKNNRGSYLGIFVIPFKTLSEYVKKLEKSAFKEIVIFNPHKELIFPTYYQINKGDRRKTIRKIKNGTTKQ